MLVPIPMWAVPWTPSSSSMKPQNRQAGFSPIPSSAMLYTLGSSLAARSSRSFWAYQPPWMEVMKPSFTRQITGSWSRPMPM